MFKFLVVFHLVLAPTHMKPFQINIIYMRHTHTRSVTSHTLIYALAGAIPVTYVIYCSKILN